MLKNQRGISIVEILMALVISSIVTTAVITLFSNSLDTSRQLTGTAKLDQVLNSTIENVAQDIQRAGYSTNATASATNVFFSGTDDVTVTGNTCVTLSYQTDTAATPATGNRFGYRLNSTTNSIEYRTSGSSCITGAWSALTDSNIIKITAFSLTLNTTNISPNTGATSAANPYTSYRSVTISITGQLVSNSSVSRTITRTVKIFNNKYTP